MTTFRKKNRLEGYDYSQPGWYFITVCTKGKAPYFCRGAHCAPCATGLHPFTKAGEAAEKAIKQIPEHYCAVKVDKYVVMPNHIHMILVIEQDGERRTMCAPTSTASVPRIVKAMKEAVTKELGCSVWQRSYHDHIIRSEEEYLEIWAYIDTNPAKWAEDCYYEEA
jgi:REP element-mobilizing transposase RayT